MDLGLEGKRAVVGGSSSGLGLGTARALAAEGCRVVVCGRDPERLEAAVVTVPGAVAIRADLATPDGAIVLVDAAREALGGIDIVVPNAGGPPAGTFETTDLDAYLPAIQQNLLSAVALCRETVPEMRERGWGRVVAITSLTVRQPSPVLMLSNTARAGLTGFLKTLATEVAADGVTVNSIQPGLHATPRMIELYGDGIDDAASQIPAGRTGDADDFGKVVAFLCSEAANYVTGAALQVDGGAYAGLQ